MVLPYTFHFLPNSLFCTGISFQIKFVSLNAQVASKGGLVGRHLQGVGEVGADEGISVSSGRQGPSLALRACWPHKAAG